MTATQTGERTLAFAPSRARSVHWSTTYVRCLIAIDLLSGATGALVGYLGRFGEHASSSTAHVHIAVAVCIPILWAASVGFCRGYEPRFAGSGREDISRVLTAAVRLLAAVGLLSFAGKLDLARTFAFSALAIAALISLSGRAEMRVVLRAQRSRGRWENRAVVVGSSQAVLMLVDQVRGRPFAGLHVAGACTIGGDGRADLLEADVLPLGTLDDIMDALQRSRADTVAVASCPEMDGVALRRLAWELEGVGVDLLVAPLLMDVAGSRIHIRPVSGLPLLHVEEPELTGARQFAKSLFDRFVATVAMIILMPLLLLVAVAVKVTSRGPVLFHQIRVGKNGLRFSMVKFRSMSADAETKIIDLTDQNIHGNGPLFKIQRDPRITRVGRLLRRFSVDELPQLLNIVRGDMSLVGPRPPLPAEVEQYNDDVHRRLMVRPGLTGLWQVSGRSDLSWQESVRLDLHYVENWSLALDTVILARTARAVLGRRGAY